MANKSYKPVDTGVEVEDIPDEDIDAAETAYVDTGVESEANADVDSAEPVEAENGEKKSKISAEQAKMTKLIGVKSADVLAYNPESHRLVTAQGGKYELRDGELLHLMGPKPASLVKAEEAGEA